LTFTEKSDRLIEVSEKTNTKNTMMNKIKWLVDDLGLNELNAWLWITGGAALTAAALVLLSGEGPEIWRFWRVFFLKLF
jgi:hypothetical protein